MFFTSSSHNVSHTPFKALQSNADMTYLAEVCLKTTRIMGTVLFLITMLSPATYFKTDCRSVLLQYYLFGSGFSIPSAPHTCDISPLSIGYIIFSLLSTRNYDLCTALCAQNNNLLYKLHCHLS